MWSKTRTGALLLLLLAALQAVCMADKLKVGFYDNSCPYAETLVQQVVDAAVANDSTIAPALVRLYFHDCFVRGCDASVLLDSTPYNVAEKDAEPSKSLRGFDVIDDVKMAVEAVCPEVVSCADILAFAAGYSAALSGKIVYEVPAGRRDGEISRAIEVELNIPSPHYNATQLLENFAAKGLAADDLVTLSGAHSFGHSHCDAFSDRLYNFSSTSETDPTLSTAYADLLKNTCPFNSTDSTSTRVWLDVITAMVLDNKYYVGVKEGLGLLTSDQALMDDEILKAAVEDNARHPERWAAKFRKAMVKMGNIQVLTGRQGQIRANCRVVNGFCLGRLGCTGDGSGRHPDLASSS